MATAPENPPARDVARGRTLTERLEAIHELLREKLPKLARISIAIHDSGTDSLHTLAHSSGQADPLSHYGVPLAEVPSLKQLAETGAARVLNDLQEELSLHSQHSRNIVGQGYRSSYTVPLMHHGHFLGFVFFNAYQPAFFTADTLPILKCAAHLVALTVGEDFDAARILMGAVIALSKVTRLRDPETGAHLERMAGFARLIALELAAEEDLSDEYVEDVFLYAPLHDVGKLTTPDAVLLKPGRLSQKEWAVMQQHPDRGCDIINIILENADTSPPGVQILYNIVRHHHESYDGHGYPRGLAGEAIPLEARMVTVADAFDALTTSRPYKDAWSNAEALAWLREQAGRRFDPRCVAALEARLRDVERIQARYRTGDDDGATGPAERSAARPA